MKTVERHKKTDFGDVWYVNAIDGTYRFAVYKYDDDNDTIYLSNVFVKEDSRRQGYGNEILASTEEYADRLGASVICLKVLSGSDVHRWYKRHGYEDLEKDEEERGYMWMKKDLKKVNESIWADINRRSQGQQVKKEDAPVINENDLKKAVKRCIRHYVEHVLYFDKYDKSPETFYKCIKNGDRSICGYSNFYDTVHMVHVNVTKVLPRFIHNNWEKGESYKSVLEKELTDEEKKIRETGFVKKPGESIFETVSDWYEQNSETLAEDYAVDIEEYADEYYSEGGSRNTDIGVDDWWDNQSYIDQVKIYQEYIGKTNESIWGDINRRSQGQQVRKEDDVNILDLEEFYEYIKKHYKTKVEYIDLDSMGGGNGNVLGVDITENIILFYKPQRGHILLSWSKVKIPMPFFDELTDRFKIENPNAMRRIITEKDGSCTNKTFIDVIDFFLGHKESLINESIWGDINRRSQGQQIRKEDEINGDEYDFLNDCLFEFSSRVVWDGEKASREKLSNCIRQQSKGYQNINVDRVIKYVENHWDDVSKELDYLIELEEKDKEDGMNESIWGDINRRSQGQQVRKEDSFTKKDRSDLERLIELYGNEVVYGRGMNTDACNLDDFCDYIEIENEIRDLNKDRILQYVKDNWIDEICDEVDASIEQASLEYHQDMYESVWADINRRSQGQQVRKEDDILSDNEILAADEFTKMYCRHERAKYIQHKIVPPPSSLRKENDYEGLIKYIEDRRDENLFTDVGDYDKIIRYIKKNWDKLDMDKNIKKFIFSPTLMKGKKLVECDGVPGGITPANVGGMGEITFPGEDGTPGSGDIPMPTGHVYHQVAPFGLFIKAKKGKNRKKKFRKEDEPCVHSENPPIYSHVDDFRDYVDRVYNQIDRKK